MNSPVKVIFYFSKNYLSISVLLALNEAGSLFDTSIFGLSLLREEYNSITGHHSMSDLQC